MKIIALSIVKANTQGGAPWILGTASDVKDFGYFQRSTGKAMKAGLSSFEEINPPSFLRLGF